MKQKCESWRIYWHTQKYYWRNGEGGAITCFSEIGKVSRPHCSGVLTISLVISLHDLQTEAQNTTTAREGHDVSLSSTFFIMSNNSSGGKFAHWPCSTGSSDGCGAWSGAMCDRVRLCQRLHSDPRLETLPIPPLISFNSRTMLLKDILVTRNDPILHTLQPGDLENQTLEWKPHH